MAVRAGLNVRRLMMYHRAMGTLRLILALTVACGHIFPSWLWGVQNVLAVKAFFVISGFYMALILQERYAGRTREFYLNRILRLFPLHLFVLAVMLVLLVAAPDLVGLPLVNTDGWRLVLETPRLWGLGLLLALSNVTLIGADVTNWTCLDAVTYQVFPEGPDPLGTGACLRHGIPVSSFLLNGPMWTIGIELVFYALAPLLALRSTKVLLVVTLIASIPRFWLVYGSDLQPIPWYRSVVAFELVYFLLGMLSYRLYRALPRVALNRVACWLAMAALVVVTAFGSPSLSWWYILGLALLLPFGFQATNGLRADAVVGDLSYPVYTVQWLVLGVMNGALRLAVGERGFYDIGFYGPVPVWWIPANVAAVLTVAVLADRALMRPLERVRHGVAARWARRFVDKGQRLPASG